MTLPIRFPGRRYTDNDEPARRRARDIARLEKSYTQGSAYSDIESPSKPNATKDYDLFNRIRPSRGAMTQIVSGYSEKVRKRGGK